ncbi:hypothetical protein GOV10_00900, partial [Candidatus Woesearchaeota archaeon]|nr:hypothetical protein [Candidatus Woesearchaeota archaeon]
MVDPTADYGKKKKNYWRLGGLVVAGIIGIQALAVATKVPTKMPEQANVVEKTISVQPLRAPLHFLESPQSAFYAHFWDHHTPDEKNQLFDFYEARNTMNPYSLADYALIAGRISGGEPSSQALSYLERAIITSPDKSDLAVERLAFLKAEAHNDYSGFFRAALQSKGVKRDIYSALGEEREVKVRFADEQISYHLEVPKNATRVVLGTSKIIVEDDDVIGTQVERV